MKYLVTVQQMATDPKENMDFVATWSGVIREEDLYDVALDAISEKLREATVDSPPSMRPMTDTEIAAWRNSANPHVWIEYGANG